MSDFHQLAVAYVIGSGVSDGDGLPEKAAATITNSPRATNPVKRWVESAGEWVNPAQYDPVIGDDERNRRRGRAMDFLRKTLDHLRTDVLIPREVTVLTAYFGSLLEIDAVSTKPQSILALTRLSHMTAFTPQNGEQIFESIAKLDDDFDRLPPQARADVLSLVLRLVSTPAIKGHFYGKDDHSCEFFISLIPTFGRERNPGLLKTWFTAIKVVLAEYSPRPEATQQIFDVFAAYFPVAPRWAHLAAQESEYDALRLAIRDCFAASEAVVALSIPFLLGKLDQGVTAEIKLDILQTLRACFTQCGDTQQVAATFSHDIWGKLKWEIMVGEDDRIKTETELSLREMAKHLKGARLKDLADVVLMDCAEDLAEPAKSEPAGRLLCSILGSSPFSYAQLLPKILRLCKTYLSDDKLEGKQVEIFLGIVATTLESRLNLLKYGLKGATHEVLALKSVDDLVTDIFSDILLPNCHLISGVHLATDRTIKVRIVARCINLLLSQPTSDTASLGDTFKPLLPKSSLLDIYTFILQGIQEPLMLISGSDIDVWSSLFFNFVEDFVKAMACLGRVRPSFAKSFATEILQSVRTYATSGGPPYKSAVGAAPEDEQYAHDALRWIAYVCGQVPSGNSLELILHGVEGLLAEVLELISSSKASPLWHRYVASLHLLCSNAQDNLSNKFSDSTLKVESWAGYEFGSNRWDEFIHKQFPGIPVSENDLKTSIGGGNDDAIPDGIPSQVMGNTESFERVDIRMAIRLIALFSARALYRHITAVRETGNVNEVALAWNDCLQSPGSSPNLELLSTRLGYMAHFALAGMSPAQQIAVVDPEDCFTLFRGRDIVQSDNATISGRQFRDVLDLTQIPTAANPMHVRPELAQDFGPSGLGFAPQLLMAYHPQTVRALFDGGFGQSLLVTALLRASKGYPFSDGGLNMALSTLSNKYKVEENGEFVSLLEELMGYASEKDGAIQALSRRLTYITADGFDHSAYRAYIQGPLFSIMGGVLRRCTTNMFDSVLESLRSAPSNLTGGQVIARRTGALFAPNPVLSKTNHAIVNPLWLQRAFVKVIQPMLQKSWPAHNDPSNAKNMLVAGNYTLAVLWSLVNIDSTIYEAEVRSVLRTSLTACKNLPPGLDLQYAMTTISNISFRYPAIAEEYLDPIIQACRQVLAMDPKQTTDAIVDMQKWMPEDYLCDDESPKMESFWTENCQLCTLTVLHAIATSVGSQHLLGRVQQEVARDLNLRGSFGTRKVRGLAAQVKDAWRSIR